MYASWTGSSWETQAVPSAIALGYAAVSLALDSNGYPHILYGYAQANQGATFYYAVFNGSGWTIQKVVSNPDVGGLCNLVFRF